MNLSYFDINSDNLIEVLVVVGQIFPEDINDITRHYNEYVDKKPLDWKYVRYWNYFCVKDENNNIVGVTGLYNESDKHSKDEVWLGWFGVSPGFRGRGFGEEILKWTIEKARSLGYKKFKLWTTTDDGEVEAQKLYEKLGLKIYDIKKHESGEYEILYREMLL